MKKMLVIAIAISLVASAAWAGVTPDAFSSGSKIIPIKDSASGTKIGLLDCAGATEISLDVLYSGDNTGAANNVSTYGCSTWNEAGGEVIFHIFLATPTMWTGTISNMVGGDLDLAVLDQCDEDLGCLIVVDSSVITNVPVSGDFYFVVDGYNGAASSFDFILEENVIIPPDPIDFCGAVEDVFGTDFTGTTCTGVNNVSSLGCETYTEAGLEYYYEIFMPAGSTFTADVTNTADGALWVVDACTDPINCLAYADDTFSGDTETVTYSNVTANDMYVYLVVDSWGADSCGDYDMTLTQSGGVVAVEEAAFGAVKALYR
jgi:hypothetical protein